MTSVAATEQQEAGVRRLLSGTLLLFIATAVCRSALPVVATKAWDDACQASVLLFVLRFSEGGQGHCTTSTEVLVSTALGASAGAVSALLRCRIAVLAILSIAIVLIHHPCPNKPRPAAGVEGPSAAACLPSLGFWQLLLAAFGFVSRSATGSGCASCLASALCHTVLLVAAEELVPLLAPAVRRVAQDAAVVFAQEEKAEAQVEAAEAEEWIAEDIRGAPRHAGSAALQSSTLRSPSRGWRAVVTSGGGGGGGSGGTPTSRFWPRPPQAPPQPVVPLARSASTGEVLWRTASGTAGGRHGGLAAYEDAAAYVSTPTDGGGRHSGPKSLQGGPLYAAASCPSRGADASAPSGRNGPETRAREDEALVPETGGYVEVAAGAGDEASSGKLDPDVCGAAAEPLRVAAPPPEGVGGPGTAAVNASRPPSPPLLPSGSAPQHAPGRFGEPEGSGGEGKGKGPPGVPPGQPADGIPVGVLRRVSTSTHDYILLASTPPAERPPNGFGSRYLPEDEYDEEEYDSDAYDHDDSDGCFSLIIDPNAAAVSADVAGPFAGIAGAAAAAAVIADGKHLPGAAAAAMGAGGVGVLDGGGRQSAGTQLWSQRASGLTLPVVYSGDVQQLSPYASLAAGHPATAAPPPPPPLPDIYGCDVADMADLEDLMSLEEVEAVAAAAAATAPVLLPLPVPDPTAGAELTAAQRAGEGPSYRAAAPPRLGIQVGPWQDAGPSSSGGGAVAADSWCAWPSPVTAPNLTPTHREPPAQTPLPHQQVQHLSTCGESGGGGGVTSATGGSGPNGGGAAARAHGQAREAAACGGGRGGGGVPLQEATLAHHTAATHSADLLRQRMRLQALMGCAEAGGGAAAADGDDDDDGGAIAGGARDPQLMPSATSLELLDCYLRDAAMLVNGEYGAVYGPEGVQAPEYDAFEHGWYGQVEVAPGVDSEAAAAQAAATATRGEYDVYGRGSPSPQPAAEPAADDLREQQRQLRRRRKQQQQYDVQAQELAERYRQLQAQQQQLVAAAAAAEQAALMRAGAGRQRQQQAGHVQQAQQAQLPRRQCGRRVVHMRQPSAGQLLARAVYGMAPPAEVAALLPAAHMQSQTQAHAHRAVFDAQAQAHGAAQAQAGFPTQRHSLDSAQLQARQQHGRPGRSPAAAAQQPLPRCSLDSSQLAAMASAAAAAASSGLGPGGAASPAVAAVRVPVRDDGTWEGEDETFELCAAEGLGTGPGGGAPDSHLLGGFQHTRASAKQQDHQQQQQVQQTAVTASQRQPMSGGGASAGPGAGAAPRGGGPGTLVDPFGSAGGATPFKALSNHHLLLPHDAAQRRASHSTARHGLSASARAMAVFRGSGGGGTEGNGAAAGAVPELLVAARGPRPAPDVAAASAAGGVGGKEASAAAAGQGPSPDGACTHAAGVAEPPEGPDAAPGGQSRCGAAVPRDAVTAMSPDPTAAAAASPQAEPQEPHAELPTARSATDSVATRLTLPSEGWPHPGALAGTGVVSPRTHASSLFASDEASEHAPPAATTVAAAGPAATACGAGSGPAHCVAVSPAAPSGVATGRL
ncbi:hypothetical protein GPECTOR_31g325 [Gonium pectorale]|uniref:Uncharacterized protein n=1 Tax=Gonium pectorale TaxID=33097 RepID=A0A150GDV6_GONPE|nr:hypothetical protein GPECTOR_31g325 [Gonium pectorale]|eukprot:KXZ47963.1 hypothetical protein GPECTOR_31g325 [Gonium pectorale]